MRNILSNRKAFVSLIGLFLAIIIIAFVGYKAYGVYLGKPSSGQRSSGQDHSIATQAGTFQHTKERIRDINKMLQQQAQQLPE